MFAKYNGLTAGLFVLAGGIPPILGYIEQVIYFWDHPLWRESLVLSIPLLFFVLAPIWVLRSRSLRGQAAGLLVPIVAYFTALVSALSIVRGFSLPWSISIADAVILLLAAEIVAIILYAWISSAGLAATKVPSSEKAGGLAA